MMGHVKTIAAAGFVAILASAGSARADQTFAVEVWIGNLGTNGTQADSSHVPTNPALTHATFDFTGSINWVSYDPANAFGSFIPTANISNYSGSVDLATLSGKTLSTSGDGTSAFFQITGVYSAASDYSGSVTHDDGASLYTDVGPAFLHPDETAALTNSFSLPAGVHPFTLDYVEGNGSPSVLQIDFPADVAAPEPISLTLLGSGLAGLALVRRRRR